MVEYAYVGLFFRADLWNYGIYGKFMDLQCPPNSVYLHIYLSSSPIIFLPATTFCLESCLVSASAGISPVGRYETVMDPFSTASLSQKRRRSKCFILP